MVMRTVPSQPRETPSTRDVILDAGERLFAERGVAGVSMREIAAEAGLRNQGSLYHHFRDKDDLYAAVIERGTAPVAVLIVQAQRLWEDVASGAPLRPGDMDTVVDQLLDYLAANPAFPRLIQRASLDDARFLQNTFARLVQPLYAEGVRLLAGTVGPWQPDDLPHVAAGIFHMIFGCFANATMFEAVTGQDLRSPRAVAHQRRFLKTAIAQLLGVRAAHRLPPSRHRRPRS
jgi:AcrR family transcriptional regulator